MAARMLDIIDPQAASHAVAQAVAVLEQGGLLVIPTETVYGILASAASVKAVAALRKLKQTEPDQAFALHLPSSDNAGRYLNITPGLRRMMDKLWPGPVTLVVQVSDDVIAEKLAALNLPADGRDRLYSSTGSIRLRCPNHPLARQILAATDQPIIASAAALPGEAPAVTAAAAIQSLGDHVDLVLDGGHCRYGKPSTVVHLTIGPDDVTSFQVDAGGVYDERIIRNMTRWTALMICSGNTCRSAMAAGIGRQLLAERRGIAVEDLEAAGLEVISAGVYAGFGMPAAHEAVEAMRDEGIDLTAHRSQPLTADLIHQADVIYCMTESHRRGVLALAPDAAEKTTRLDPQGDIEDPIGSDKASYQRTAATIRRLLTEQLEQRSI